MIIGVSGKINSGKDTVGKIIQYLTSDEYKENPDLSFEDWEDSFVMLPKWKIKKFADKLKDVVCILLNCTREQLEDHEFKDKELGKEWDKIIHPELNGVVYNDIDIIEKLTPRKILQLLGTECGRNIIHPNIWINAALANYEMDGKYPGYSYTETGERIPIGFSRILYNFWVFTDVRFPNEADAILKREGILIRINRPYKCSTCGDAYNVNNQHVSETALDNYNSFTYTINNSGTIQDLTEKVKEILKNEKLI